MFGQLMHGIAQDFVRYVMHVQVVQQPAEAPAPTVLDVATHSADDETTTALQAAAQQALTEGELGPDEAEVAAASAGGGTSTRTESAPAAPSSRPS